MPTVRASDQDGFIVDFTYDEHGNTFKSRHQAVDYLLQQLDQSDLRFSYRRSTEEDWQANPPSAELLIMGESFCCADDCGYFMTFRVLP